MDVLAVHDRRMAAEAIEALRSVRTSDRDTGLAVLIDDTLDDLTGAFIGDA